MRKIKRVSASLLLSAILLQSCVPVTLSMMLPPVTIAENPISSGKQISDEDVTTGGKDYLLVTLDFFNLKETGDDLLKGDGEIFLYTVVTPLHMKDGQWKPNETNPGSQSNIYPFPNRLWVEVPDNQTTVIDMPIYTTEWESAPENLSIFIYAMDNDEWPIWVSDAVTGLAAGLQGLGGFLLDIANFIESLPIKIIEKLIIKEWFISTVAADVWIRVLKTSKYYTDFITWKRYAELAIIVGKTINLLHGNTLLADTKPDKVFEVQINSDEIYWISKKRPVKSNDWGISPGDPASTTTYQICDISYYDQNKINTQKEYNFSCGSDGSSATLSFRKVKSPPQPIRLDMWLYRLELIDDKESSTPEFYFHTRLLDAFPQQVDEIPGAHTDYAKKLQFKGQTHFVGITNRYPRPYYYPTNFYPFSSGNWKVVNALLTPHSASYVSSSPFLYYEINFFEDDTGAVFEDAADWIGSATGWLKTSELEIGKLYTREIALKNIVFELRWIAQDASTTSPKPQIVEAATPTIQSGLLQGEKPSVYYLGFNHAAAPFNDTDARKAFAALVDREVLIQKTPYQSMLDVIPSSGAIPYRLWKSMPFEQLLNEPNGIPLDPEYAQIQLANAYEYGELTSLSQFTWWPKEIRLAYIQNDLNQALGEYLKLAWESAFDGFSIVLMGMAEENFWATIYDKSNAPEAFLFGYGTQYDSPEVVLIDLFTDGSLYNLSGYQNPHFEWQLGEARALSSMEEREAVYLELERMLLEDDAVIVPIFQFDDIFTPILPETPPPLPAEEEFGPTPEPSPMPSITPSFTPTATLLPTLTPQPTPPKPSWGDLDATCLEYAIDHFGSDYQKFVPEREDPMICMLACLMDKGCGSFTFVMKGYQGDTPFCYLKYGVPPESQNEWCISGVRSECLNYNPQFE